MPDCCLTVRTVDRLFIVRQNEEAPTDQDWDVFLKELRMLLPRIKDVRAIVFSDGGGPTTEQRKKLSALLNNNEIMTAVISDKGTVRFVVATIGLFNKSIRTYGWQDAPKAFAWLGLTQAERRIIASAIAQMSIDVRSKSLATLPTGPNGFADL